MSATTRIVLADGTAYDLRDAAAQQAIQSLDASQIVSGTLDAARIPGLSAAKITGGVLDAARVPDLDAAKIASGTLGMARLPEISRTYYPNMEAGGINVATGANYATGNLNRFRSVGRIAWKSGATVTMASGYSARMIYFDANGDYSGESAAWDTGTKAIPECGYYRILARNTSITDFTGKTNDAISVTDAASIEARILQIFGALESLGWQEG